MGRRLAIETKGQKSTLLMSDKHNVSHAVAGLQLPPVHRLVSHLSLFYLACLGMHQDSNLLWQVSLLEVDLSQQFHLDNNVSLYNSGLSGGAFPTLLSKNFEIYRHEVTKTVCHLPQYSPLSP